MNEIELFAPESGPFMRFPCDLTLLHDSETGSEFLPQVSNDWVANELRQPRTAGPDETRPRVAVIDSGVLLGHSWIAAVLEPDGQMDFTGEGVEDQNGHGTVTALFTIAAWPRPLRLLSAKVVGRSGRAEKTNLVNALRWAGEQSVGFVVLSAGVFRRSFTGAYRDCDGGCDVCRAAVAAINAGVQISAAGGNSVGRLACPATLAKIGHPGIIGLGPLDENGVGVVYVGGQPIPYESRGSLMYSAREPSAEMRRAYDLESVNAAAAISEYEALIAGSDHLEAAHARARLAELCDRMGDTTRAETLYREVIDGGQPHAPIAAIRLGNLLNRRGNLADALAAYQVAIDAGDRLYAPMALHNVGNAYQSVGDLVAAESAYRAAAALGPSEWAGRAMSNLGVLLWQQSRTDEAREVFAKVISWMGNPAVDQAAVNLGMMERRLGNNEAAVRAFEIVMALGTDARKGVAAINLADIAKERGAIDEARSLYELAAQLGIGDTARAAQEELRKFP